MLKKSVFVIALMGATALSLPHIIPASDAQTSVNAPASLSLTQSDRDLLLSILRDAPPSTRIRQLETLESQWTAAYVPAILDILNFIPEPEIQNLIQRKLKTTTGQDFGSNTNAWYKWLWNQPAQTIDGYDDFKADFHSAIDKRFDQYFRGRGETARIRLDEIRWGGVRQDGIPPLRNPKMISAADADYLEDDNIIFGIEVNGDVRAYPKRILAWHEMFVDEVGGVDVAGVYCTLCGTVILYDTDYKGQSHALGTSGFLYRSNKLMYDKATQSLWNTIKGEPVLGPLVDKGIALDHRSVVTTTWGKWRQRHPDTQVLSLDTGHNRDYGEGVAYHNYFATDRLMFNTPFSDKRLKNKQEVLALRFKEYPLDQLAISADFLKRNPVYVSKVGEQKFVVLTDETGANRVYDPGAVTFAKFDGNAKATDSQGQDWKVTESKLIAPDGQELSRLPYHRAFWFGWHATYPNSRLVK